MIERKYIAPDSKLPVRFSTVERDFIVERAFLDPRIETQIRKANAVSSTLALDLTLDDIDDLLGCVAAEANHCDDGKIQRVLDAVCDRLGKLLEQFTDEGPVALVAVDSARRPFTAKQGQYLAFIHYYGKIHGVPPAEADLQKYFKVSPPVVHTMIMTLERKGLIERVPGKARSIQLRVKRTEIPDLA